MEAPPLRMRALGLLTLCCPSFPPPGLAIDYGTAGFRAEASTLPSTVFRTGVLAALRSRYTGAVTGLVITASHNPEGDNGIKVRQGAAQSAGAHISARTDNVCAYEASLEHTLCRQCGTVHIDLPAALISLPDFPSPSMSLCPC